MLSKRTARNGTQRRRVLGPVTAVLLISVPPAVALIHRTFCVHDGEAAPGHLLGCVCWVLVLCGITGTALASRGVRWGWLLLVGLQPMWIAYALATSQHGLVAASLAYGAAQLGGFVRTTRLTAETGG